MDPNYLMLKKGSKYFEDNKKINEICSPAEGTPLQNKTLDTYAISFGIRNTFDTKKAIDEAFELFEKDGEVYVFRIL